MKQLCARASFVVVLLLGLSTQAHAGLIDWMQEWSGPGPYHHRIPPLFFDFCDNQESFSVLGTPGKPAPPGNRQTKATDRTDRMTPVPGQCLYVDYRDLQNTKDPGKSDYDNFPIGVRVKIFTAGLTRRVAIGPLDRSVSAGVGGGLMFATGQGPTGKTMVAPYLEFPRIVVKPMLFFRELHTRDQERHSKNDRLENWLSIWQVHFSGGVIIGPFGAEDLGVDPALSSFQRDAEFVVSRGLLVIDGARFLRAIGVFDH